MYAVILTSEFYDKVRKFANMPDIEYVKADQKTNNTIIKSFGIPTDNVFYLENSTKKELDAVKTQIAKIITKITKKGEGDNMFLYVYFAGHGCSDKEQYFVLNEAEPKDALYKAEANMRMLAERGHGLCYLFAVYDICREDSSFFHDIIKQKALEKENARK